MREAESCWINYNFVRTTLAADGNSIQTARLNRVKWRANIGCPKIKIKVCKNYCCTKLSKWVCQNNKLFNFCETPDTRTSFIFEPNKKRPPANSKKVIPASWLIPRPLFGSSQVLKFNCLVLLPANHFWAAASKDCQVSSFSIKLARSWIVCHLWKLALQWAVYRERGKSI